MVEMNSKLEQALTAKQESEAKVTGLESKVSQYETEIASLRKQVGWMVLFWIETKRLKFFQLVPFLASTLISTETKTHSTVLAASLSTHQSAAFVVIDTPCI